MSSSAFGSPSASLPEPLDAMLLAVEDQDADRLKSLAAAHPALTVTDVHVAAALGRADVVSALLGNNPERVNVQIGPQSVTPLFLACASPLHGESSLHDAALLETVQRLLAAGADPNIRETRYGLSALYLVTGMREVLPVARLLLDAGATPDDGESVFHAAQQFHEGALELLLDRGADLSGASEMGNTPLGFLLRWHDVANETRVHQGIRWLLEHGADPNVPSGVEQASALHVAVQNAQDASVVDLLLAHGALVTARRGDGATAWRLAARTAQHDVCARLEAAGAAREELTPHEQLMAACARADASAAQAMARAITPAVAPAVEGATAAADIWSAFSDDDRALLPWAASRRRWDVVNACMAVRWPLDAHDTLHATALHWAALAGAASVVQQLLAGGAPTDVRDDEHKATPLQWAQFGADHVHADGGDYPATLKAFADAGVKA